MIGKLIDLTWSQPRDVYSFLPFCRLQQLNEDIYGQGSPLTTVKIKGVEGRTVKKVVVTPQFAAILLEVRRVYILTGEYLCFLHVVTLKGNAIKIRVDTKFHPFQHTVRVMCCSLVLHMLN